MQIIPLRGKDRKYSKSLSWLNQELFTYFKHKKEDCTKWKLGQLAKANCSHINQRSYSREREGCWRVTVDGLKRDAFVSDFNIKVSCSKVA